MSHITQFYPQFAGNTDVIYNLSLFKMMVPSNAPVRQCLRKCPNVLHKRIDANLQSGTFTCVNSCDAGQFIAFDHTPGLDVDHNIYCMNAADKPATTPYFINAKNEKEIPIHGKCGEDNYVMQSLSPNVNKNDASEFLYNHLKYYALADN
jgi:hypothetical protein